jgi:uncharacterized phage protein (TIGR02218 family)
MEYSDFRKGRYRMARIYEYWVDWRYPFVGPIIRQIYYVEETNFDTKEWKIEAVTLAARLKKPAGIVMARNCRYRLGDSDCNVSVASYKEDNLVVSTLTSDSRIFHASNAPNQSDDYWKYAKLTWTLGDNTGVEVEVAEYTNSGRIFRIWLPMPYKIQTSDRFTIWPGCNGTIDACDTKFSNSARFGGFPLIPGQDSMQKGPIVADVPTDAGK